MLTPEYTASATLTSIAGGELVVAPAGTSLAVTLIPFMRGEKGDAGEQGQQGKHGNDGVGIDNFDADPLAIYLISRG